MQEAVCTLCTSFGSWTFFGLFPFKGTAYGAYGCIRPTMESGLSPTVCRHWDTSCPSESKVHTAVHTAFRPGNPYRPPIDGISQIGISGYSHPTAHPPSHGRIQPACDSVRPKAPAWSKAAQKDAGKRGGAGLPASRRFDGHARTYAEPSLSSAAPPA